MDLCSMPDEWLLDIFIRIEFARQFSLRRCCKKWQKLCRSRYVLRTVLLRDGNNDEELNENLPSRRLSYEAALNSVKAGIEQLRKHVSADIAMPKRRMFFVNIRHVLYDDLFYMWKFGGISSMELRNVGLSLGHIWNFEVPYKPSIEKYVSCPWDRQVLVMVTGRCVDFFSLLKIVELSLPLPPAAQMEKIVLHWKGLDSNARNDMIHWISEKYELNLSYTQQSEDPDQPESQLTSCLISSCGPSSAPG